MPLQVGEPVPEWNARAQDCAMMMGVAKMLSHTPATDWPCYTDAGAMGAAHSNISYERPSASFSIDSFIFDWGNDTTVGHRRWLLVPGAHGYGYGFFDAGMQDGKALTGSCVVTFDQFVQLSRGFYLLRLEARPTAEQLAEVTRLWVARPLATRAAGDLPTQEVAKGVIAALGCPSMPTSS